MRSNGTARAAALAWLVAALAVGVAVGAEPAGVDSDAVIDHLNAAISWYRHVGTIDRKSGEPSDSFYLENARAQALQALQLAFQVAQAQAAVVDADRAATAAAQAPAADGGTPDGASGPGASGGRNLARAAERIAQRISQTEAELEALTQQILQTPPGKRADLKIQRETLEAELELAKAQHEAIQKINTFMSAAEMSKVGLGGRIEQLKTSVPEAAPAPPPAAGTSAKNAPKPAAVPPAVEALPVQDTSGLFGRAAVLFGALRSMREVDHAMVETRELQALAKQLQAPLMTTLRATIQQGREVADAPPTTDRAQLEATRRTLEALTTKFKQLSAATVPLRQEAVLLDQVHANLQEWRISIRRQYGNVLRNLVLHAGAILVALGLVIFLSAIWRRATFKYVADARRRRQFQLLRRFVTGFLMLIVIVLGFVSEFGSLATFAGFLTAGIAVALQTVILSVAAYFFLIGRYGLRVGDRITVSGVTGDVVDIGLVRLYLMELSGTGVDLYPTGRVVVLSNSVLFQATPLFKQIPGTEFLWREVAVALAPGGDYALAERKMLETVQRVYQGYQAIIESQHKAVERLIDVQIAVPTPNARLQFTDAGLECLVRYPVEIRKASDVDDLVTRGVMEAIDKDPAFKATVSGSPRIRSPIKA